MKPLLYVSPVHDLHPELLIDAMYRAKRVGAHNLVASFNYLYWNKVYPFIKHSNNDVMDGAVHEILLAIQKIFEADDVFCVAFDKHNQPCVSHQFSPSGKAVFSIIRMAQRAMDKGMPLMDCVDAVGEMFAIPCYNFRTFHKPELEIYKNPGRVAALDDCIKSLDYEMTPDKIETPQVSQKTPPSLLGAVVVLRRPYTAPPSRFAWMRGLYCAEFVLQMICETHNMVHPQYFPQTVLFNSSKTTESWMNAITVFSETSAGEKYEPASVAIRAMMDTTVVNNLDPCIWEV